MEKLYVHTESIHNTRAAEIVVPIMLKLFAVDSVLDVGCGTGTWLKVFKENHHINDVLGLDGNYLEREQLVIDSSLFKEMDLREPFDLKRKFDLVICLEVAEHLPKGSAKTLINSICKHSDTIVFSAAIPGQGGQNHINEQWPHFWEEIFNKYGFSKYDIIRSQIWENEHVDTWYRQNIFVYSKSNLNQIKMEPVLANIHPTIWKSKIKAIENLNRDIKDLHQGRTNLKTGLKIFIRSIINIFRK